ncbi:MAG TPA: Rne/Rng family ribonuclease [Candidatus Latescibacteria bacterium]|nr:Rne/Rng family ribonuclease [Candidatus Latescibacterota bacterium]
MKTEIIVNSATQETRIAILEDGRLVEILVERPDTQRLVGNIYKGIVTSILPGMQAAFVDIGMEKSAFLHARDVGGSPERLDDEEDEDAEDDDEEAPRSGRETKKYTPIQELLTKGQEVIVQITKEPIGTKGPRVTTDVSLPGRFSVLMPYSNHVGVSRKILGWSEKRRLKALAARLRPENCGIIVRTVAEGQGEDDLTRDINDLKRTWERVHRRAKRMKAPALIHSELGMTTSLMRDLLSEDVERVVVDSKSVYNDIIKYLKGTAPQLRDRVLLYDQKEPVFDAYGIEQEIANATNRRVPLRKGGFLVIDHTEAMVTIDVNTGRYVGRNNQEQTIVNINLEAGQEIARQLRLRDIGGIIAIDFIDMAIEANRKKVWEEFNKALRHDRSRINVAERLSEFGVLEMTRQRVRPSLLYTFSEPCPLCKGSGRVQSPDTTVTKLERWLKRLRAAGGEKKLVLEVHPTVGSYLRENDQRILKALRRTTGAQIILEDNPSLEIDAYRFSSLKTAEDLTAKYEA